MDLLQSVLSKVKAKAQELGKRVSDEEGFFQQGKFTPLKAIRESGDWSSLGQTLKQAPQTFFQKRYVEPVKNIPSSVQKLFSPTSTLSERAMGGLGVLGGLATFVPDPIQDIGFPLYDIQKAKLKAEREKLPLPQKLKAMVKAGTGEETVGLGEAIIPEKYPVAKTALDIAEIPLAILATSKLSAKQAKTAEGLLENLAKKTSNKEEFVQKVAEIVENPQYKKFAGKIAKIDVSGFYDRVKGVSQAIPKELEPLAETKPPIKAKLKIRQEEVAPPPLGGETPPPMGAKLKTRGVIITARESEFVDPVIKSIVRGEYVPKSNKETYKWAANLVSSNLEEAEKFVNKMPPSAETTAVASYLVKKYQDIGDYKKAENLIEEIAKKATRAGQFNQAFSQWRLLTPEGMQKYAQRVVSEANEKMGVISKSIRKILGKETKMKLTNEDYREINNWMKLAMRETDEAKSAQYIRKVFEVINKKIPWGVSDVLDEFRYNNMLSNPLTHLRNFTSNAWQAYVVRPITLLAEGRPKEAIKYEASAISAIPDAIENFIKTLKEGKQFKKMDVDEITSFGLQKPKVLGRYNIPSQLLEATDSLFSTIIEAGEKARGKTPEEAYKIAQRYLFREDLRPEGQGWVLNKIDDATRAMYGLRKVGLGWVIPFIRTPMNVAKQWIEYSPLGFSTMIGATNKREQLAKALVGSTISLLGVKLAFEDRVTGRAPTDPLAKKLFYDSGKKPFSIRVGNVWIPAQTFGTFGFALILPAIIKEKYEEDPSSFTDDTIDKVAKSLLGVAEYWSNQTFVKNVGDFVRLFSGDTDYTWTRNLASIASQLKPMSGFVRYISTIIDPIFRKPKTLGQTLISDIPFLSKNVPYYETTTGEPARRNITNYLAPYAMGIANPEYEGLFRRRMEQLKSNAVERKIKEEAESGESGVIVKEKVALPTKEGVKVLDLSEIKISGNESEYEKAIKTKKAFTYVDDILDSTLPVEKQAEILAKLGITPEDAAYYNVARQTNDIKYIWVKDEVSKYGNNRQEILNSLISMRKEINGKMILTNGVIDDLVDEGILSSDEGKYLKKVKFTKKGEVRVKLTGRGKSAKIKVPKIKATKFKFKTKTPKLAQIKSMGGITKIKNRGRIFKVRGIKYK